MKSAAKARQYLKEQGLAMLSKTGVRQWALAALVFFVIVLLMVANMFPDSEELAVGRVATRDIAAPFRVENVYRTELERDRAARQAELAAIANDAFYVINPRRRRAGRSPGRGHFCQDPGNPFRACRHSRA